MLHRLERGCAQPISTVHVSHVTSSGVRTLGTFVVDLRSPVESSALAWPYAERTSARAHALPCAAAPQHPGAHTHATGPRPSVRDADKRERIEGAASFISSSSPTSSCQPACHCSAPPCLHRADHRRPHLHGYRLIYLPSESPFPLASPPGPPQPSASLPGR
jgi:hypothetical protein